MHLCMRSVKERNRQREVGHGKEEEKNIEKEWGKEYIRKGERCDRKRGTKMKGKQKVRNNKSYIEGDKNKNKE